MRLKKAIKVEWPELIKEKYHDVSLQHWQNAHTFDTERKRERA